MGIKSVRSEKYIREMSADIRQLIPYIGQISNISAFQTYIHQLGLDIDHTTPYINQSDNHIHQPATYIRQVAGAIR